ncbi:MAG: hypothetical protein ACKOYM_05110 [Actinomycetes bacterium]
MADRQSPPKKMLIIGVVLLLLGLGGCGYGAAAAKSVQTDLFAAANGGTSLALGASRDVTATSATLLVFLRPTGTTCTGSSSAGATLEFGDPTSLPISTPDGGERYDAAYVVTVRSGEVYSVTCGEPGTSGRFAVASLPVSAGRLGLLATAFSGGGVMLVLGVGLTIGGIVGRFRWTRRHRAATDLPAVPAPGSMDSGGPPPPVPPPAPPQAPDV